VIDALCLAIAVKIKDR